MEQSFKMQQNIGIANDGESDELKRVFLEGNPVLLAITMVVSMLHSVFDFLAFKNDVAFWKENKSMEGLSARSIMINAVCQAIIFFYLLDNDTSMVVLLSSGEEHWAKQAAWASREARGGAGAGCRVVSCPRVTWMLARPVRSLYACNAAWPRSCCDFSPRNMSPKVCEEYSAPAPLALCMLPALRAPDTPCPYLLLLPAQAWGRP
jgi:hypothetical protein